MTLIFNLPALGAVKIGNLHFKHNSDIERTIAQSVRPVNLEYVGLTEYIGIKGSCTLLRSGKECFVACSRHQLKIPRGVQFDFSVLEHVRFASFVDDQHLTNVPVDNLLYVTNNPDEEFHDVLLFHVSSNWRDLHQERRHFFPIKKFVLCPREISWAVGYPTQHNRFTYEPQKLEAVSQMIQCAFDGEHRTAVKNFKRYSIMNKHLELDGLSGGAVFSLVGELENFEIVFDGLIVRAGNGNAYVIDSSFLLQMAKRFTPHSHSIIPGGLRVTS